MSYQGALSFSEFSLGAQQINEIRERFLAGGEGGLERLPPCIRDSWLRCRQQGVDLPIKVAPVVLSEEQVRNLRKETALLLLIDCPQQTL